MDPDWMPDDKEAQEDEYGDYPWERLRDPENFRARLPDELFERLQGLRSQIEQLEAQYDRIIKSLLPVREGDIVEVQRYDKTERMVIKELSLDIPHRSDQPLGWYASGTRIRKDGKPGKLSAALWDGHEYAIIERKERPERMPPLEALGRLRELDMEIGDLQEKRETLLYHLSPVK